MAEGGRFITFEGGDGVGKSTQLRLLAETLRGTGREVVETREPGGNPAAEGMRELLKSGALSKRGALTEALLFAAARSEHVGAVVAPALERGAVVLSDRFTDSTHVYQAEVGEGLLDTLDSFVTAGVTPDLTILLDLPVDEGQARRNPRGEGDAFEAVPAETHEQRRQAFLARAAANPKQIAVIDASGGEAGTAAAIATLVRERLGLGAAT